MTPTTAHPTDGDASHLSRGSVGLTPAHVEVIRMLAQIAVENYLRKIEAQPARGGK